MYGKVGPTAAANKTVRSSPYDPPPAPARGSAGVAIANNRPRPSSAIGAPLTRSSDAARGQAVTATASSSPKPRLGSAYGQTATPRPTRPSVYAQTPTPRPSRPSAFGGGSSSSSSANARGAGTNRPRSPPPQRRGLHGSVAAAAAGAPSASSRETLAHGSVRQAMTHQVRPRRPSAKAAVTQLPPSGAGRGLPPRASAFISKDLSVDPEEADNEEDAGFGVEDEPFEDDVGEGEAEEQEDAPEEAPEMPTVPLTPRPPAHPPPAHILARAREMDGERESDTEHGADGRKSLPRVALAHSAGKKPDLWRAVEDGHFMRMRHLLNAKANPEEIFQGYTALMKAAEDDTKIRMLQGLLDRKANVETANANGRTALSFAAAPSKGKPAATEALQALLKAGANPDRKDRGGKTPKEHAEKLGHIDALAIMDPDAAYAAEQLRDAEDDDVAMADDPMLNGNDEDEAEEYGLENEAERDKGVSALDALGERLEEDARQDEEANLVPEEDHEDVFHMEEDEAAKEDGDEAIEEEQQGKEEENDESGAAIRDELKLNEVPAEHEDAVAAVESSNKIRRILSGHFPAHKEQSQLDGIKKQAAKRWGLQNDALTIYVLQEIAQDEGVEELLNKNFKPSKLDPKDSEGSQVAKMLLRWHERSFISGDAADPVSVFRHRWKLKEEDEKILRELPHKVLRYLIMNFKGEGAIADAIVEAEADTDSMIGSIYAAPDKPGLYTIRRFNRLELIKPTADALVVGDANLTFSNCLATHRAELCHIGRVIATTFEDLDVLKERYEEIEETLTELSDKHAEVYHNVDCTRLAVDTRFLGMQGQLGAVYYNFPHAGAVTGFFDGHPFVRWRHENLMHLFFRALRSFVQPDGIVKISSNSSATGVRFSDILGAAAANEFEHVETFPFQDWIVNRYRRSYGDRRDRKIRPDDGQNYRAQQAQRDMVYAFRYAPTGKSFDKKLHFRRPPKRQELDASREGPFKSLKGEARQEKLEELSKRFISEVQGFHVG